MHHVLQRAHLVVIAGSPFERQRLLPDDLDLADVGAVPDRFEHAIGQACSKHVPHGGHRQKVVDAKHVALIDEPAEQAIQSLRAFEVLTERLLENQLTVVWEPDPAKRRDGDRKHRRRQRQVDGDWPVTRHARRHAGVVREVEPLEARRSQQFRRINRVGVGRLALQPVGCPAAELLVVPIRGAGRNELEPLRQVTRPSQGRERRDQKAACQVASTTEDDESIDHVGDPFDRRSLHASASAMFRPSSVKPSNMSLGSHAAQPLDVGPCLVTRRQAWAEGTHRFRCERVMDVIDRMPGAK